jgi:hypothetical protein
MDESAAILPERITIEFTTPGGLPIRLGDLGQDFLEWHNLVERAEEPCRFEAERTKSSAGNDYFKCELYRANFPDGFSTRAVVEKTLLRPGTVRESKKGNLMRSDTGEFALAGVPYLAKLTIVRSRKPYWVSFVAHRKPNVRQKASAP